MAGPLAKYALINAKVRARISKLLSEETLQRMIRAGSLEEALGMLHDTPFNVLEEIYANTGELKLGELELVKNEIGVYMTIEKYVHKDTRDFVHALLYRYEIDNLKNAIRLFFDRKIRKRSIDEAVHYILYDKVVHNLDIDAIVNADNLDDIAEALKPAPYSTIIDEYKERVMQDGSLFRLEMALDHFFYKNLINQTNNLSKRDRKEALRLIGVEIDLQNINWIMRFKNFYSLKLDDVLDLVIPSGFNLGAQLIQETYSLQNVTGILQGVVKKNYPGLSTMLTAHAQDSSSRFLLIERVLEQIMKQEIHRILVGYPFTIGIILSYFILKRNEVKQVRTVLNAKQYAIAEERVEGMI